MNSAPISSFAAAPVAIRSDLAEALDRTWQRLAQTSAWLDSAARIAVASEARHAWDCALCKRRKEAVSPYTIDGIHDHREDLPQPWIEVIHRVVTDSGRITERWFQSMMATELLEDEYVEICTVVILVTSIDAFAAGIGMPVPALPAAGPGAPERRHYDRAAPGPGWVSTVAPENAGPEVAELYRDGSQYIRRALTLVPEAAHAFWDVMYPLYMPNPAVEELEGIERAISRAQIEFLAARVSALLDCFY